MKFRQGMNISAEKDSKLRMQALKLVLMLHSNVTLNEFVEEVERFKKMYSRSKQTDKKSK